MAAVASSQSLHRDFLAQCQSCLAEMPPDTEGEKTAVNLLMNCFMNKIISKDVSFPSDDRIRTVFDQYLENVVQQAAEQMIKDRVFTIHNKIPTYRLFTQKEGEERAKNTPEGNVLADTMARVVKSYGDQLAKLKAEIELLQEWSETPFKVFTDQLDPV